MHEEEEDEGRRPYVKKPLNAFMVYMKEQRPFIDLELKSKGNGVVNMYLAQKVCLVYVMYFSFLSIMSWFNMDVYQFFISVEEDDEGGTSQVLRRG